MLIYRGYLLHLLEFIIIKDENIKNIMYAVSRIGLHFPVLRQSQDLC